MKCQTIAFIALLSSIVFAEGSESECASILRIERSSFSGYKPNYYLMTPDKSEIKLNFSFKYQIFNREESDKWDWLNQLYFGYSQKSFWDIGETSAPFKDHNFNPELLYQWHCKPNKAPLTMVQFGLEHHSNGTDGNNSRSWNRAYIQPFFSLIQDKADLSLKLWYVIDAAEENKDITDYWGYGEIQAAYKFFNIFETEKDILTRLSVMKGMKSGKGNVQVDISFPLQILKFEPHILLQYFYGDGEMLLTYNESVSVFRIGFLLTKGRD